MSEDGTPPTNGFNLGRPDAFEQLWQELLPLLKHRLAARFGDLLSHEDREDVARDALLRLWVHRAQYDPARGSVEAWVWVIARNLAISLRRQRDSQARRAAEAAEAARRGHVEPFDRKRLNALVEELSARDQAILLAYMTHGGRGEWTQEVARTLGCTPNAVRIRKWRLINELRRRAAAAPSPSEEVSRMADKIPLRELFAGFRQELRDVARRIAEASREPAAGPPDPDDVFTRLWNQAIVDGTMDDPGYGEMLQRRWCREQALREAVRLYRQQLAHLLHRAHGQWAKNKSVLLACTDDRAVERCERGVFGLADRLRERRPARLLEQGQGQVEIDWIDADKEHDPDGLARWEGEGATPPLSLAGAAAAAFRRSAELPRAESAVWARILLDALRNGELLLPEFRALERGKSRAVWLWQSEPVIPWPLEKAPDPKKRLPEDDAILPLPVEMDLGRSHPALAEALDKALYQAACTDEEKPAAGDAAPALDEVVRELQKVTGADENAVVLLLAPLLERRLADAPGKQGAYRRALDFLWRRVTRGG